MAQVSDSGSGGSRSASEIRDHVIEKFNMAVRRPGMYYGAEALRFFLDTLAFIDGSDAAFVRIVDTNYRSVSGAAKEVFGGADVMVEATLAAEQAFPRGWLRLDRELSGAEYAALLDGLPMWQSGQHLPADLLAAHGPASVTFGSTNPIYPKTFAYVTADPALPMVLFYFGHRTPRPRSDLRTRVVLLAVRVADQTFPRGRLFPAIEGVGAEWHTVEP